jgi:hypothetical protein
MRMPSSGGKGPVCRSCGGSGYATGGEVDDDSSSDTGREVNVNAQGEAGPRGDYASNREDMDVGMRKTDNYARRQRRFDKGAESNDDSSFAASLAKRRAARRGR